MSQRDIIEYLERKTASVGEMAKALRLQKSTVSTALKQLHVYGFVEFKGFEGRKKIWGLRKTTSG